MRVVLLNYVYEAGMAEPEELLGRYETLTGWAEGVRGAGLEVEVVQRFSRDARLERGGVLYHFVADRLEPSLHFRQLPFRAHRKTASLQGGLVHVNGLLFPLQLRALRHALLRTTAIVAQHHAERPKQGWRGVLQRWGLEGADGFFFAARDLAQPWLSHAVREHQVFEVMEGSSTFAPKPKEAARARTGMVGQPIFLWVGHLIPRKDPITVLRGFEEVLRQAPQARLYMVYGESGLLGEVEAFLASRPSLHRAVTLLGCLPHDELPWFYSSADYFVLGSRYEGSGYALAEALACGVVPIVSDIPSFRMMTDGGRIGGLWTAGSPEAFAQTALRVLGLSHLEHSSAARAFFEARLSFPAIGRQAATIYRRLAAHRRAG